MRLVIIDHVWINPDRVIAVEADWDGLSCSIRVGVGENEVYRVPLSVLAVVRKLTGEEDADR